MMYGLALLCMVASCLFIWAALSTYVFADTYLSLMLGVLSLLFAALAVEFAVRAEHQ